jgi:glycosyltransferase involved in cell wall biosynthesis
MSARPLILVGALPPPIDGQSLTFELVAHGLPRSGREVYIVDFARPGEFARSRAARAFDYAFVIARFVRALAQHPGAGVYLTVAQSRAGFLRDLAFVVLARLAGRRVAIHVHGGNYGGFYRAQPRHVQRLIRRTLSSTSKIIVLAERLRGMFDFAPELAARIVAVPNGFPGEAPNHSPKQPPAPGEPWRVLFLSNLIESKGYLEAIEAVAQLAQEGAPIELALCGEFRANPSDDMRVTSAAQARELTLALIRARGLEGRVQLRGTVQGEAKRRALAEAQVFVLPTRYDAEGQPLSVIEAMAHGCAVVATAYRGIPDLVEDGVTGCLLPSHEPAAIAAALRRIIGAPQAFAAMSAAARARYAARFTPDAHLEAMKAALADI